MWREKTFQISTLFNLKAFTITETDEKLIAVAAITGESKIPKIG